MSLREIKFWYWIAKRLPKKLLYFTIIHVWARASAERHKDKHIDEITLLMAAEFLDVK